MSVQEKTRLEATGPADPLIGRELRGFHIESVIGRGGMGVVYKARQHSLGRAVAIKVLPATYGDNPQFVERFRREVDVLSRLSHPNIVTVIERGDVDGCPFVAMEYVEGTTLREVMRKGPLPRSEALLLVRAILSALEHAHGKGIIHRDIKPENVLVAPGGIVKVADFGLGRLLGPADATRLTHTHLVLGTFEYMAPEQRERAKEADERADLYATGVMLYEMIAGELPIGIFAPLSEKRPQECDRRIDQVVRRSLEKDPQQRYQRASEMGDDVSRLLTHAPFDAMPPPAAPVQAPEPAGTLARAGAWVTALLRSWPVARITGKVDRRFARDTLENREVQLWLRRVVPGLWETFPSGVEFEKDSGRIVMKLEATIFPQPGVPQRLASAVARVLEARAPDDLRSIASADAEWEATLPPAPLLPPELVAPAPPRRRGLGAPARFALCAIFVPLAAVAWTAMHSFRLSGAEWVLWACATAAATVLLPLLLGALGRWGWLLVLLLAAPFAWFAGVAAEHRITVASLHRSVPPNLLIDLMSEPEVDAYIRAHAPVWPAWPQGMRVFQDPWTIEVAIPRAEASRIRAQEVGAVLSRVLEARAPANVVRMVRGDAALERRLAANAVPGGATRVER